ncbi:hypothetical protein BOTBODRAFT_369468 [Botryobasidium botryosum FD-172 SS1]|uniref:Beta-lactamase-related domain-containing protein n=1 Tax=Botryobasidium botryosum (strain FD-172 SS1) TaxID=930990 RepID=A0A067MFM2_BOTB1|nr:hypothetical protein BOTBODRAFT_369468 [Botryobasidium botryosum FD-172 SS1]
MSIPEIDDLLKSYTDKPDGLLGLAVIAVDRDSRTVYSGTAGKTSTDPSTAVPMSIDNTVHWIASQTKLLTTIAVMQCVERGQIKLEDTISDILPEFAHPQILEGFDEQDGGKPKLRAATTPITLEMLLTHTSGLAADRSSPGIGQWMKATGFVVTSKLQNWVLPLLFEPGTSWVYGIGIDWAGYIVERLNNCTLGTYMETHIFGPLGITSMTFRPADRPDLAARLAVVARRLPDGTLGPAGFGPMFNGRPEDDLGGAGLYCTAADYSKVLSAVLRGGAGILKPESVDEIFKPRLSKEVGAVHGQLDLVHTDSDVELNFGLGVSIAMSTRPGRRAPGSISWGGLPCQKWWIDRETGIAATIFQQMFPPTDPLALEFAARFEEALYKHVRG